MKVIAYALYLLTANKLLKELLSIGKYSWKSIISEPLLKEGCPIDRNYSEELI